MASQKEIPLALLGMQRSSLHLAVKEVNLIDALEDDTIEFSFSNIESIARMSDGPFDVLNPSTLSCRLILLHLGALHLHVGTNTAWMMKMVLERPDGKPKSG